jgi:hypothetical protein
METSGGENSRDTDPLRNPVHVRTHRLCQIKSYCSLFVHCTAKQIADRCVLTFLYPSKLSVVILAVAQSRLSAERCCRVMLQTSFRTKLISPKISLSLIFDLHLCE